MLFAVQSLLLPELSSPSAEAFRISAKNVAAQCSIVAAKLQEEMQAETPPSTN